ncbi:pantothenate kinase [bacterium]|jgi:type III pantothenate kinase|nr:pantothenate kinase [bacterium]
MLWAIDIGNTQTNVGVHDGNQWVVSWRHETYAARTEDEIAGMLLPLAELVGLKFSDCRVAVFASVVPPVDTNWQRFCEKYLGVAARFLRNGAQVGMQVTYDPPHAVGADRIANALGALARFEPPIVVVDFGTATTFDCVDATGAYAGGAIMPGIVVSLDSLVGRTAKLPAVALDAPERAVGRNTVESLQSGVVLGYADAIDGLARRIKSELGESTTILATGGLGRIFVDLCEMIDEYDPVLTLEGLRLAADQLA